MRAAAGRRSIDDGQDTPLAKLLAALAGIFAHVTQEQVVAALLPSPDDGVAEFLARVTVEELWGKGEMALWGQLSVANGEPLANLPDKPHRRLGLERIPATTFFARRGEDAEWERIEVGEFSLILEDAGTWSVGDGRWRWVEIHVTYRGCRTAEAEARDRLRRIGAHRKAISNEALQDYVNARPELGRPRLCKALTKAGYGVTRQRVANAVENRHAGKDRLKGGRPPRQG